MPLQGHHQASSRGLQLPVPVPVPVPVLGQAGAVPPQDRLAADALCGRCGSACPGLAGLLCGSAAQAKCFARGCVLQEGPLPTLPAPRPAFPFVNNAGPAPHRPPALPAIMDRGREPSPQLSPAPPAPSSSSAEAGALPRASLQALSRTAGFGGSGCCQEHSSGLVQAANTARLG